MRRLLIVFSTLFSIFMQNAQAQPLSVDPESIVPLPDKFDMEMPAPDVPPEIARFQGAWIGTWQDDRHILVVERVTPDGHANVVFAQSDSAFYSMNREWWRDKATIADGVLTMTGFRTFRYAFDGPDRLYMTATLKNGGVTSGTLVRTDAIRLAAGDRPIEWPWPGERVSIPHLTVRTPDGARPIMLEATFYPPAGPGPAPLAIFTHGSDVGRNQLRTWSFSTEAHWLRDNGFAVLALMRRGRGRSEGINGEEDFGRDHEGSLMDVSAGIAQAVEDDPLYRTIMEAQRQTPEATMPDAILAAVHDVTHTIKASAIVCWTKSGSTGLRASRERPEAPIIALTPLESTCQRLTLSWGVTPVQVPAWRTAEGMVEAGMRQLLQKKLIRRGEWVVAVAGTTTRAGGTNLLRIVQVGRRPDLPPSPADPLRPQAPRKRRR